MTISMKPLITAISDASRATDDGSQRAVPSGRRHRAEHTYSLAAIRYDDLDYRLMDTFPASDAVARY